MKILFVFGGVPHYYNKILNLIHEKDGYDVSVISPSKDGKTIGDGVFQTVKGISFNHIELLEKKTFYRKPFFKNFYETVDSIDPDIVIIGWPYYLNFFTSPLKFKRLKKKGTKFICKEIPFSVPGFNQSIDEFREGTSYFQRKDKVYNNILLFGFLKRIRKTIYSKMMNGAVLYREDGVEILHSYGMDKKNIFVTYNSIVTKDTFNAISELNSENNIEYTPFNLIHVGRLVKWKRVDLLIEAISILKRKFPNISLTIVGGGEEKDSLVTLTNQLNISDNVIFKGAIYDEKELSKCFLKAHVYVLAGMGGLSINEAMCHSLPIICSICDGTEKHLVFEGENGSYFESDNLDSLVLAIERVIANPELRLSYGKESRRIIEEEINENVVVQKYLECFDSISSLN